MTAPPTPVATDGLRLGVTPWRDDWSGTADSLAAQAEVAERLGFHSFWLPESHFTGRTANPAPLLRLAVLAGRTRRLRLATTSFLLPVRHPLHVAAEVADLDRLSQGRVILGVGRGFRRALFRAFGVPASEKRDRFEANLRVILSAWRGEPIRLADDAEEAPIVLAPLPVQRPHPPVWVAGFGPKAVAQAGRLGLPYLASPLETLATLEENYARHRAARGAAAAREPDVVPVMRAIYVSRDAASLARVRDGLARQAAGLASAPVASMRRHADAPVEEWALVGEPEQVADGIRRYRASLGVTHLIARTHVPGASVGELETSLELLAGLEV